MGGGGGSLRVGGGGGSLLVGGGGGPGRPPPPLGAGGRGLLEMGLAVLGPLVGLKRKIEVT